MKWKKTAADEPDVPREEEKGWRSGSKRPELAVAAERGQHGPARCYVLSSPAAELNVRPSENWRKGGRSRISWLVKRLEGSMGERLVIGISYSALLLGFFCAGLIPAYYSFPILLALLAVAFLGGAVARALRKQRERIEDLEQALFRYRSPAAESGDAAGRPRE